jgi:orotate phosphoribosyltransferase-like protein
MHYSAKIGVEVDITITQANRVFHTGANAMERLLARAEFAGDIEHGRRYVQVDDVTTMGSTLADLASHIRSHGGEVAGSVSERLTNSEIESLRQHKKESLAYMQKNYFPNAKIHQAA